MEKVVLCIFSHPDDAEILCSGTLSLLKKAGWAIHIATHATGDKGTGDHPREEIISMRNKEAHKAASLLEAEYHCLGMDDIYIFYNKTAINQTTALIRRIRPSLVITASPQDYMVDHETTSRLVLTASFAAGIRNMEVEEDSMNGVPYLYYCDPMEGKDILGNPVRPSVYVDITGEIQLKVDLLACHESQRNWLMKHHGVDEYIQFMKRVARKRGSEINTEYAEGFRQHLGHGFPQENLLKEILGPLVIS